MKRRKRIDPMAEDGLTCRDCRFWSLAGTNDQGKVGVCSKMTDGGLTAINRIKCPHFEAVKDEA